MIAIIYALIGVIVLQSIIHRIERKDLYNRIMSKDYAEYKGREYRYTPSAHDRVLKRWRGEDGENE